MCMIINRNEIPKVAEKDIEVFKVFQLEGGTLNAPYQTFKYELDTLYQTEIGEETDFWEQCPFDDEERQDYRNEDARDIIYISTGFHSAVSAERLGNPYNRIILKCIVPKGSLYLINKSGLMVSNQIFIRKEDLTESIEECA
jgi:hypothetical protein